MFDRSRTAADMDCRVCRVDSDARRRWGCEQDAPAPVARFECWSCSSAGRRRKTECADCGGTGHIELRRCPWSRPGIADAVEACRAAVIAADTGTMPAAGGWIDQTSSFHQAFWIIASERGRYRDAPAKPGRKG